MKKGIFAALILMTMFLIIPHVKVSAAGSLELLADEIPELTDVAPEIITPVPDSVIEAAKPAPKWSENFSKKDLRYLASIIYCEANSMSYEAKVGVGNVVLNRLRNTTDWGHVNTIREVIYDRKWGVQFDPTATGYMERTLGIYDNLSDYEGKWQYDTMKECIRVAKLVMQGEKVIPDTYVYFNGYVEKNVKKCHDQGKDFRVFDGIHGHIYF